jgi:pyruvate formate lyase activating enzyme
MRIAGFQPLTLLDYPGKVAATVFTQGCPFRCAYCHNPELLPVRRAAAIGDEEVLRRLAARRDFLDGVCVTGGEPTLQPDLPDFLARLKALGLAVKLDTNGLHPRMVEDLMARGLVDYLAMDLKHVWRRYHEVIGTAAKAAIANCRATAALIEDGGVAHEFRTTVTAAFHSETDLLEIAEGLRPGARYALQAARYGKTLSLVRAPAVEVDLEAAAARIRAARPDLRLDIRA